MDNLIYKIKQLFRKLVPLAIIGALLYGGYHMYRRGAFRHGIGPAVSSMLHSIPYFGTRFKHYVGGSSYSYSSHHYRGRLSRRGGHRHRRHHRRYR